MKRLLNVLAVSLGLLPPTGIGRDLARAQGIQPGTVALEHGAALLDPFLVRAGFEGAASPPDWWHPDDTIAAGPANLVLHGNSTIAIRSKTGALGASMSVRDFFASVRNPDENVGDPWIVFDPISQRFFYVADGSGPGNPHFVSCAPGSCVAHHLIAVSKSAAPATLSPNDWYFYALDRTIYRTKDGIVQTANWGDFDSLAIDETAVVIKWSAYAFGVPSGAPGQAQGVKVRVVDKGKLIRGETPMTWTDIELKDPQTGGLWTGPTEPAMGSGSPGPFFLLSARGCDLVVWALDHASDVPQLTSRQFARAPCSATSPGAVQPGGVPIDPVHTGHSLVYRNGSLWYAHLVGHDFGSGLVSAVRWIQLDVSGWPQSVRIVQDAVFGEASSWQLGPAIMVDAAGNAVIVFARSSSTEFPSLYFTGRLASDPPNVLRPAALLKAGTAAWEASSSATPGRNRYIDFLGAALDPADGSIWVFGPYVKAPRQRGTWAANIVPTPSLLPTATAILGAIAMSTTTRSAAPAPSSLGGRSFALRSQPGAAVLTWNGGTGQTGYTVWRLGATSTSVGPLPGAATAYTDAPPPPGMSCYALSPLVGIPPSQAGNTDVLCILAGGRSFSGSPLDFTIWLDQSTTVTMSWQAPLGASQDGYLLMPLGGAPIPLPASSTTAIHPMSGPTCYVLLAMRANAVIGNTDILCGLPGLAHVY